MLYQYNFQLHLELPYVSLTYIEGCLFTRITVARLMRSDFTITACKPLRFSRSAAAALASCQV